MPTPTPIEWTDFSSNPLKYRDAEGRVVWACVKHSAGCAHCYAEALAKRYGRGEPFTRGTMDGLTPFLDEKELKALLTDPKLTGTRVFLGDMTDIFGDWVPEALLDRLLAALAMRPDVTFQLLTKRADRMRTHISGMDGREINLDNLVPRMDRRPVDWPARNIWLGVSVENQAAADLRIPDLIRTPAAVRFLSCEPLIGDVHLGQWLYSDHDKAGMDNVFLEPLPGTDAARFWEAKVNWVIVGGESGPQARPCDVAWVRSIVEQCSKAGCPAFVKQLGSKPYDSDAMKAVPGALTTYTAEEARNATPEMLNTLEECLVAGSLQLRSRKGGDMDEWPEDLRVRKFPRPEGGRRARR